MTKLGVILQARMGSSRLPEKVLKELAGRPMIDHIVDRLQHGRSDIPVIIATTVNENDDALAEWAKSRSLLLFRGSENDVLDRYYQCAKEFDLKHIIRATGDNPFVDSAEYSNLMNLYLSSELPYACSLPDCGCGLPVGVGLEIFSFDALKVSWNEGTQAHHREHVDEFILENEKRFPRAVLKVPANKTAPLFSLTVDTPDEMSHAENIYTAWQSSGQKGMIEVEWVIAQYS